MSKPAERTLLFLSDFLTINATFWLWAKLRAQAGYFSETLPQQFLINALVVFGFWFLLFVFYGLYRVWHAQSRVDECIDVGKAVSIGVLLIFFMTLDLDQDLREPLAWSRALMVSYWLLMIVNVSAGRLALRTFQRTLLEAGYGVRNTLLVGCGEIARDIFDEIRKYPALGYDLVGFVGTPAFKSYKGTPWLGELHQIAEVIEREQVEEVIIALENAGRQQVTNVLSRCVGLPVRLKIVPDLNDAILGQVRAHQIYGVPLIEALPESMPAWERRAKRLFDVCVALSAGIFLFPLGLAIACMIRLSSHKHIVCGETFVGKAGKPFQLYRFCVTAAAAVPAERFLRSVKNMGWDRMPHLLNVLKGDLSVIGPQPESPAVVEKRTRENPFYARRLMIQPGLTGWAQIKGKNDDRQENCSRALQFDFYYIENRSLRMDVKILLIALYNALFNHKLAKPSQVMPRLNAG